jgi:hypothetical protein
MSKTESKAPLKGKDREVVVGAIVCAVFRKISPLVREAAEAVTSGEGGDGFPSKISSEVKRLLGQVKEVPGSKADLSEELRTASGAITDDDFKYAKVLRDASGASFRQIGMELATDPAALNTRFLHGSAPKPKKEPKPVKAEKADAPKGEKPKRERKSSKSGRAKKAESKGSAGKPPAAAPAKLPDATPKFRTAEPLTDKAGAVPW